MTEEQLQAIRERWFSWQAGKGDGGTAALDLVLSVPRLLAYVAFLQKLLHDLKQESTAYQRGLELGMAAERERCLSACHQVESEWNYLPTNLHSDGIAQGARRCAAAISGKQRQETCPRCHGSGTVTPDDGWGARGRCPVCSGKEANHVP